MSQAQCDSAFIRRDELETLLQGQFGRQLKLQNFSCELANTKGDNYGSTLLSLNIDIKLEDGPGKLFAIAKLIPNSKFLQQVFDVSNTFCKEINLYRLLLPELRKLQEECGMGTKDIINLVPDLYGARTSFDDADDKDNEFDAVLILGDLKQDGYTLGERLKGLDLKHCEIAISQLASFQALVVMLRKKKPEVFKEVMSKVAMPFHIGDKNEDKEEAIKKFVETLGKNIPECSPLLYAVKKCMLSHRDFGNVSLGREPFATLVHNDFWTNNMLFTYESKVPNSVKLIDFQATLYCSPIRDLVFFMFSSAQRYVIEKHVDHLVGLYFDKFISQLKNLNCNVSEFSKSAFFKELDVIAPMELYHILFMTSIIYLSKEDARDVKDISSKDDIMEVGGSIWGKQKVIEILNEYSKRGWIREFISETL